MTDEFKELTIDAFKELSSAVSTLRDSVEMLHDLHKQEIVRLHERLSDLENRVSGHTIAMLDLEVRKSNDFTGI